MTSLPLASTPEAYGAAFRIAIPRSWAFLNKLSADRFITFHRLWFIRASKGQSQRIDAMRSSFPIANPTASAKPSSLILNNSSKAPPERVISFKSLACSGSWRWSNWTFSKPSRSKLSSSDCLAREASKEPLSISRSRLVDITKPSGRPPRSLSASPILSSDLPNP